MHISMIDAAIVVAGIVVTSLIGVFFSKYSKSVEGFFVAGRKMNYALVLASMLASWHGISFYLWLPGAVYTEGWGGWVVTCGSYCVMDMIMGYFLAYKARSAGQYTVPDLFGKAYGEKTQLVGGASYFIYEGVRASEEIVACALVLNFALGMNKSVAIIAAAIFVTVYCFTAGQYAVFITDFIQYILMVLGLALLCFFTFGPVMSGGNAALIDRLRTVWTSEAQFLGASTYSVTQVIGFAIVAVEAVISPLYYSRAFSAKDAKTARDGILSSLYAMVSHDWMLVTIGVASVVILGTQHADQAEQATLYLADTVLPVGVSGIVFAALVAAGLSTINSHFISGASNLGRDIYQKFINPEASQKQIVNVGRIGIVILAVITTIVSLQADSLLGLVYVIGQIGTSVFAIPILMIFFSKKPKTSMALYLSMGVGLVSSCIWYFGAHEMDIAGIPMPAGLFGTLLSLIAFLIGNMIGEKRENIWETIYGKAA